MATLMVFHEDRTFLCLRLRKLANYHSFQCGKSNHKLKEDAFIDDANLRLRFHIGLFGLKMTE